MTTNPVGGVRLRLIRQSLYQYINDHLTQLGWFGSNRQHKPVTFVQKELPRAEEIEPNTIGLADGNVTNTDAELGSLLVTQRLNYYIDIYAESVAVGLHIASDIKDILEGRFSSTLGQTGPAVPIDDFRDNSTPTIFYCQVINVMIDRPEFSNYLRPWRDMYYSILVTLEDTYATEDY